MHKWVNIRYFFVRKFLLIKYSYAFVVMPGGMGAWDELFESITLIQTKMIRDFPVVIFGSEYHKELYQHIEIMAKNESIGPEDMKLLCVTDFVEETAEHIKTHAIKKFKLVRKLQKPKWWMGEGELSK